MNFEDFLITENLKEAVVFRIYMVVLGLGYSFRIKAF